MHYFHWIAGTILALAWFSRIVDAAIGMPSVADISTPEWDRNPSGRLSSSGFPSGTLASGSLPFASPRVSIIVPARNEEADIELTLTTLLALDCDNYEVIAVNDRSTDRTGEIMEAVAAKAAATRLRVLHHRELPAGWLGKTHAMWTAANAASGDWLLFTDADVLFKPDSLRRALAYAESEQADHLVVFPQMIMKSPGEFMMIAFFQTMFVFGHRPWKVADPKSKDHMGVGAFNLIRRSAYDAVGTYAALRMEVLDDMKLGKVVKNSGFAQRNVFGGDLISLRWARGAKGVVDNLTKNFFAVLSFQWWRTLISAFGLAFLNLMPFLGVWLAHGWERLPYAIALGSMFAIYVGMSWRSRVPPYYFLLHPVSTVVFVYTLLLSMCHALWNDGIIWRGTRYPLEELRKGMV
jgi:cellulose synthase/poly-beta-1,6-N-acetylglucosamine synthase-like glycosyltransferase